jgi:uncharacterized protein involved in type VI secretion and phage assembly
MDNRNSMAIDRLLQKHWGKYRGTVSDRDDPEHLGRLKVRVPSLLGDAVTGWAFPVSPYAGADLGFFFIPQVDDLVWVEFAEGELEQPLWTGCGWAKPAGNTEIPKEAKQSYPDRQVLKTKSGSVIVFNDAIGQEQITIRARDGCEITIDPNANLITVKAGSVLIQSVGGIPQELATKSFVTTIFDVHTHPTGVGPSGPPLLPSSTNPLSVTSVLKAE